MSKAICRGAMLSVGALATVSAAGQGIEREFSVAAGGTLVVVADDAKLDVRGGGGTDAVRVAIRRGDDDAEAIEDDYDIAFDQSDNTLRVDVERRSSGLLGIFGNRRALSITVETPRTFSADLKTSGGGIAVANLSGSAAVETSGGSLRFEDIDGDVDGRTSGGSIRLLGAASSVDLTTSGGSIAATTVRGPARMRTSGGKIAIDRAEGPLYAKTSGGSIEIKTALDAVEATTSGGSIAATFAGQPMDDSELVTSGGSIRVGMAPDIGFDIDAATGGGSVKLGDETMFSGESTRQSLNGSINGGGPKLTLRTSAGSIRLLSL